MNRKIPAIISTVSNSFCDFTLDIAVNRYDMYFILFGTSVGAFVIQLIYGIFSGIMITPTSLIFILINGFSILIGYILYVQSLKRLPVSLTGLIESGNLFLYLLVDFFCGYLEINLWFVFLFLVFMLSIFIFSFDVYKRSDDKSVKKIRLSGIFLLLGSMIFYFFEPYLIKFASEAGANEVAINFGYYFFAIPFFLFRMIKNKREINNRKEFNYSINCDDKAGDMNNDIGCEGNNLYIDIINKKDDIFDSDTDISNVYCVNRNNGNDINNSAVNYLEKKIDTIMVSKKKDDFSMTSIKFIILISLFDAIYYLFGTMGYIGEAAVINAIIQEIRVFLLFILSIVFGTDKLSLNKIIAIVLGILAVIGIYLY